MKRTGSIATGVCVALWLAAIAGGVAVLGSYAYTPGEVGEPVTIWPSDLRAHAGAADRARLVMFAHPGCSCSRASVAELARLLAIAGDRLEATVWFYEPDQPPADWPGPELERAAEAIPGVRVARDRNGNLALRLGALTSGHVLVYGSDGHLSFSGGITPSRGHEGDSAGRRAILAGLEQRAADARAPVFGCPLHDDCACGGRQGA